MKRLLVLLIFAVVGFAAAPAESGVKVELIGGTLPGMSPKTKVRLNITGPNAAVLQIGKTELQVPYSKINTLEYGLNVSRRYAAAILISPMLLISKSRKHFVTLGYSDADGNQQALIFRVDKGDIRALLASLEARTGRRVEYQDEAARKAGKG